MSRLRHAEPEWYDVEETWILRRGATCIEILTRVENQLVDAVLERLSWQDLLIGAPVIICDQRLEMAACVSLDPVQINFEALCRAATRGVKHMSSQVSGHLHISV